MRAPRQLSDISLGCNQLPFGLFHRTLVRARGAPHQFISTHRLYQKLATLRTRLRDGTIPAGEITRRVRAASEENAALATLALDEVVRTAGTGHADLGLHLTRVGARRVVGAGNELAEAPGLDDQRFAARW